MQNWWIVTPYALDTPVPAIAQLARPGSHLIEATPSGDDQLARMVRIHQPLVSEAEKAAVSDERPVSIAGDCCAVIAVIAGVQRSGIDPMVIWLDAHGDFNTHETTVSGYVGGMALAMLTGRGNQTLLKADKLPPLADTDIILADARDLDPAERDLLRQSRVTHTGDFDSLVDRVAGRPFHVHFDADVIDAADAPAVTYPVPGGPSVETLRRVATRLRETGRLVSASMTPWALDRDTDGRTAEACWSVFSALVGE